MSITITDISGQSEFDSSRIDAELYVTTNSYVIGELVTHVDAVYRCIINTNGSLLIPEAFDTTKWVRIGGSSTLDVYTINELATPIDVYDTIVMSSSNNELYYRPTGEPAFIPIRSGISPPSFVGQGFGLAGVNEESFENGLGFFTSSDPTTFNITSGGTPSNNTGPNNGSVGSNYIYFETSGTPPSFVNISTGDFRKLTTVEFDTHMFGLNIGSLSVQVQEDSNSNVWTNLFTVTSQNQTTSTFNGTTFVKSGASTQTSSASPYTTYTVNLPPTQPAERMRFLLTYGNGFTGDIAIDNIKLTSI